MLAIAGDGRPCAPTLRPLVKRAAGTGAGWAVGTLGYFGTSATVGTEGRVEQGWYNANVRVKSEKCRSRIDGWISAPTDT